MVHQNKSLNSDDTIPAKKYAGAMINLDSRLLPMFDNGNELLVFLHLVKRMNSERICWPSIKTICSDTGLSIDTVQRSLKSLKAKKLLQIKRGGGREKNHYSDFTPLSGIYLGGKNTRGENFNGQPLGNSIGQQGENSVGQHSENQTAAGGKNGNEVLNTDLLDNQSLDNEVLSTQALKREQDLSFRREYLFRILIEIFFPQFQEYQYSPPQSIEFRERQVDETTATFLKRIEAAAAKILSAVESAKRPELEFEGFRIFRGSEKPASSDNEAKMQMAAYHDYCRLTKTFMTTMPEKLPEKLIEADWPFKLFDAVKDDIGKKYDPAYDDDLLSDWLLNLYYWEEITKVCKRYNNRIVHWGDEYLKSGRSREKP